MRVIFFCLHFKILSRTGRRNDGSLYLKRSSCKSRRYLLVIIQMSIGDDLKIALITSITENDKTEFFAFADTLDPSFDNCGIIFFLGLPDGFNRYAFHPSISFFMARTSSLGRRGPYWEARWEAVAQASLAEVFGSYPWVIP